MHLNSNYSAVIKDIRIDQYDYPLPDRLIAIHPLAERDKCRLLVARKNGEYMDTVFSNLPALLPPHSMLVYNNTRVINARLRFHKGENADGALIEIFCLEPECPSDYNLSFAATDCCDWKCFVGNSKRWKQGSLTMKIDRPDVNDTIILSATRVSREDAASVIRFEWKSISGQSVSFSEVIECAGEIPIPPYLNRSTEKSDITDYQTVFSHVEGSVAAPTAGLHFTDKVLSEVDACGILRREVTLHVGAGTFQPVKNDTIGDHVMHSEFISVGLPLIQEIAATDRTVIAVGTTSVRTLETLYQLGRIAAATGALPDELGQWTPYDPALPQLSRSEAFSALAKTLEQSGATRLIATTRLLIAPGYHFGAIDGMITNFHQPRSTLLLLVSAFIGDRWRELYDYAISCEFRFLSYGDAMLLLPSE